MARKAVQGYAEKTYYDNTRFLGMLATLDTLQEGYFRHLVNVDISDTGQSLKPRDGFLTSTIHVDAEVTEPIEYISWVCPTTYNIAENYEYCLELHKRSDIQALIHHDISTVPLSYNATKYMMVPFTSEGSGFDDTGWPLSMFVSNNLDYYTGEFVIKLKLSGKWQNFVSYDAPDIYYYYEDLPKQEVPVFFGSLGNSDTRSSFELTITQQPNTSTFRLGISVPTSYAFVLINNNTHEETSVTFVNSYIVTITFGPVTVPTTYTLRQVPSLTGFVFNGIYIDKIN